MVEKMKGKKEEVGSRNLHHQSLGKLQLQPKIRYYIYNIGSEGTI